MKAGIAEFVRGESAEAAGVVVMVVVVMVAVGGIGLPVDGVVVGCWSEAFWLLGVGYTASEADIHFEAQSGFGGQVEGRAAAGVIRHDVFFCFTFNRDRSIWVGEVGADD